MKILSLNDIKPLSEYEGIRKEFRSRMIAFKKNRRVPLGDLMTLVFENRETLIYQVQEMMRTEHLYDTAKIQEEIDTYNPLIPGPGELSATLFIEITEEEKIKETLDRLQGIDNGTALYLNLGTERIDGAFETGHSKEDKLSAVHYVRFHFSSDQQKAFLDPETEAALTINHPHYQVHTPLSETVRKSLTQDLLG